MGARFALLAALALWAGLAIAPELGRGTTVTCALLGLAFAWQPRGGVVVWVLALGLLGFARGGASAARHAAVTADLPHGPRMWRVVACVEEPPRREADAPVTVLRVIAASPPLARNARVRVRLPPGAIAEWGDTLEVLARLDRPAGPRVPGGHDARITARAADLVATGRAYSARVRPARGLAVAPVRLAMRVRRAGEGALARELSPSARELAAPLLFGDRGGMATDTEAALRASGLVHLLALSGLHVTWLAAAARGVVALLGGGVLARALGGALAASAYALVAGPIPSLARAVVAESLVALARGRQRASEPLHVLGLAALLLLAWQPQWAHDLGFQLSCVATFGLVALGSPLARACEGAPRAWRAVWAPLAVTLGAQLAALPWLCARFHAVPWASFAANLVAVPLSEGLLVAAALGAAGDVLLPGAGRVWLAACEPLAFALHALVHALGAWPGALLATGPSSWIPWGAALATALLAVGLDPPRALDERRSAFDWRGSALVWGTVVLACTVFGLAGVRPLAPPAGHWWLVVLDVGQGDAIAVGTERGWWLVDTGPRSPRWDAGEGTLLPFFRWAGVRTLEAVVVTHDDGDHTGGAAALRRGIPVRAWFGAAPLADVPGACARLGLAPLARGDMLALPPTVRVLWPPRDSAPDAAVARRGDNAASLVLELGTGAGRVLLTADADSLIEVELRSTPAPALLKAGHHGSGSSSGAVALARIRPGRVALSCGALNPYGHPHAGALARLAANGARVDRTDLEGSLWYEVSALGVRRLDWRAGEPLRARVRHAPASGPAGAGRAY